MNEPTPTERPAPMARRSLSLALRVGVTSAALAWTFSQVELGDLGPAATRIAPSAALVAIVLTFANLFVGAYRWKVLLAAYGAEAIPSFGRLSRLYLVGAFYNTFLPANVGGDVLRAHVTRRAFEGAAGSYLVVAVERVFGLAGLLLLGASVLLLNPVARFDWLPLVALAGLCFALLAAASPLLAHRIAPVLPARFRLLARLLPIVRAPKLLFPVLLLSLATQSLVALTGHALISSIHPGVEIGRSFVFIPLATIAMYLPTVAGLGAREAAYVALFGTIGVASADATAASLAFFAVQLVVALVGGLVQVLGPSR